MNGSNSVHNEHGRAISSNNKDRHCSQEETGTVPRNISTRRLSLQSFQTKIVAIMKVLRSSTPEVSDDDDDSKNLELKDTEQDEDYGSMASQDAPEEDNPHEGDSTTTGSQHQSNKKSNGSNAANPSLSGFSQQQQEELAQRETRAVFRLRVLVMLVLLLAAIAVSVIVYYITSDAEREEFETQYKGSASKVVEAFESMVAQKFGAISALGVAIIAHGIDHNLTWPFVALSSFQQRARTARVQSGGLFINICPLVKGNERQLWSEYVVGPHAYWIAEGYNYQEELGLKPFENITYSSLASRRRRGRSLQAQDDVVVVNGTTPTDIWYWAGDQAGGGRMARDPGPGPYMPNWQSSPVLRPDMINLNRLRTDPEMQTCFDRAEAVLGHMDLAAPSRTLGAGGQQGDLQYSANAADDPEGRRATETEFGTGDFYASLLSFAAEAPVAYQGDPMSHVYLPIFNSFSEGRRSVAVMSVIFNWGSYFRNIVPSNVRGLHIVLTNSCNQTFTYQVNGEKVVPLGVGDLHERKYGYLEFHASLMDQRIIEDGTAAGLKLSEEGCYYDLFVYPSSQLQSDHKTHTPFWITFVVAIIFVFTAFMFFVYDRLVERRQRLVLRKATQSSAIVSSLFPENVRDRLMQSSDKERQDLIPSNNRLKSYLKTGDTANTKLDDSPIADLFPHATVMIADISGFTAWSSTRDPAQVFILLQTLYQSFDSLAKRRHVFKVETIGDSYVAVTGCPEPQANHAVIMARYAHECLMKMTEVVRMLEVTLGPETGDLTMRFGLHSGPVTAGVLKGDRARFQLFGDTVNTAARMESTGIKSKIQISQATADLLAAAGKGHWFKPRKDAVEAKGKGVMSTFWLMVRNKSRSSSTGGNSEFSSSQCSENGTDRVDDDDTLLKKDRLVDWVVDLLQEHLKKIVAMRSCSSFMHRKVDLVSNFGHNPSGTALDEVAEAISLPKFDAKAVAKMGAWDGIELEAHVMRQLRDYVSAIANTYRENSFHNFEHACHVTMAANKFLKRIVTPDLDFDEPASATVKMSNKHAYVLASKIHDYTHGLTSDPLAQLGIVFSALIHDADHRGVSNTQLIMEQPKLAQLYRNKSVAEQNSLDISWDLLMSEQFRDLRACMFATQADLSRFRQVIVNVVLATDIFDKELNDLRKKRWDKAFQTDAAPSTATPCREADLRATIVIEHIIQASDVAHTMQHWHIYRKWNERLFKEMYAAHKAGRMATDPSIFWYKGELGFFDNYIIPLAKKLKDCNVFGVSSDECLNYAMKNRAEWEERGLCCVEEMMADMKATERLSSGEVPEQSPLCSVTEQSVNGESKEEQ